MAHRQVIATGLAIAIAFGGKDGSVRSAERELLKAAYPEVRDPAPPPPTEAPDGQG